VISAVIENGGSRAARFSGRRCTNTVSVKWRERELDADRGAPISVSHCQRKAHRTSSPIQVERQPGSTSSQLVMGRPNEIAAEFTPTKRLTMAKDDQRRDRSISGRAEKNTPAMRYGIPATVGGRDRRSGRRRVRLRPPLLTLGP